jgi:hypothetical protein
MSSDAGWQEPMDDFDFALLRGIREVFERIDPMPADVPERIRFALAMRSLEAEVARIVAEDAPQPAAVRGEERSLAITFDSESLTIMIRIDHDKHGMMRIDGWLAPPQCREIELQATAGPRRVSSDDQGRFAFSLVPHGTARLVVRAAGEGRGGPDRSVVTPQLVLLCAPGGKRGVGGTPARPARRGHRAARDGRKAPARRAAPARLGRCEEPGPRGGQARRRQIADKPGSP